MQQQVLLTTNISAC